MTEVYSTPTTEDTQGAPGPAQDTQQQPHRKGGTGHSILARIPFIRSSSSDSAPNTHDGNQDDGTGRRTSTSQPSPRSMATASPPQQSRTRRRKGSLRKVALLGRGAQRDKRDTSPLTIDTSYAPQQSSSSPESNQSTPKAPKAPRDADTASQSSPELTPRASTNVYAHANLSVSDTQLSSPSQDPTPTYNSTTDEEDMLQMLHGPPSLRPALPMTSGSESYFGNVVSAAHSRRRSFQQAKSPLSYSGLASTPMVPSTTEWDYSETEWWGWVVLTVTWFVFVTGMGSCLGVWSWAWDVGKTPYAPPELEDDPTLPIVGYYPALILLTCVMAWVWVVVAWVGMKYFRHAKISGD